ncbi:hypothetical protein WA158_007904 [Blastocystis sp. Blastoise]
MITEIIQTDCQGANKRFQKDVQSQMNMHLIDKKSLSPFSGVNSNIICFLSGLSSVQSERSTHAVYSVGVDCIKMIISYAKNEKSVPYHDDPNEHGIIYWLSQSNPKKIYINPITSGLIEIPTINGYHVNYSKSDNVERLFAEKSITDKDCYFDPGVIIFHFPFHKIHPTGYMLKNGGGRGSVHTRWILQGSNSPDGPWVTLRRHDQDDTFFNDVSSENDRNLSFLGHCWPIDVPQNMYFSYFKLSNLYIHMSTSKPNAFYISGFELFGSIQTTKFYKYNEELLLNEF